MSMGGGSTTTPNNLRVEAFDAFPPEVETIMADVPDMDEPLERIAEIVVVAYVGDEPVGFASGRFFPCGDQRVPVARQVVVRPRWRQQGVAKQLFAWLLSECSRRGFDTVGAAVPTALPRDRIKATITSEYGFQFLGRTEDAEWALRRTR